MGAAASTKGNKAGDAEVIIALDQAHKGMRLFQHKVSGEIIVLFNEDMVSYLGEKARGQYDEAVLSEEQGDYFKKMKIKLAAPIKNVEFVDAPLSPIDRSSSVELPIHNAPANDQDGVRKRLSNLRVAASDKDHANGSTVAGSSGPPPLSLAEPKHGHHDALYDIGAKSRNGNQRRFVSQPYFPPSAYQQDRRLAEELHSQSFSEMHLGGDLKESPLRQEKGEEDDKGSPMTSMVKSSRCKLCNEVFFGRSSEEALEDHMAMCQLHSEIRKQLEEPDSKLHDVSPLDAFFLLFRKKGREGERVCVSGDNLLVWNLFNFLSGERKCVRLVSTGVYRVRGLQERRDARNCRLSLGSSGRRARSSQSSLQTCPVLGRKSRASPGVHGQ